MTLIDLCFVTVNASGPIGLILRSERRFSKLRQLLDTMEVMDFLEREDDKCTLFAPTDAVIQREWSSDVLSYLVEHRHTQLNNTLLFHIVNRNESLSDHARLETLQQGYIHVFELDGETKLLVGTRVVSVVETITATNGVIYVVDGVLLPSSDTCQLPVSSTPTATPASNPPVSVEEYSLE